MHHSYFKSEVQRYR